MLKLIFAFFLALATSGGANDFSFDFLMPDVNFQNDDKEGVILCTSMKISPDANYYIVGFEPNASKETAHHMLLHGCAEPGSIDLVWECGEMITGELQAKYKRASPCKSEPQLVYSWTPYSSNLQLPENVGFHVGKDSTIKYLVLSVHYRLVKIPEAFTNNSGIILKYTKTPTPRQAGVIMLDSGGVIAKKSVVHVETACKINEPKTIHPFAYRAHTHALGTLASGYVVRNKFNVNEWQLIGKRNPYLISISFHPVQNDAPIRQGDYLTARCTMNNTNGYPVKIGATYKHEMCNFHLMYWVENDTPLKQKHCFSVGPPYYYWASSENFYHIPDADAEVTDDGYAL